MGESKHTPTIEVFWSLLGERREWAWTHGPSARDLNDHGGRVVVRPAPGATYYAVPIGYAVSKSRSIGGWNVEVLRVLGTMGATESWEHEENFKHFDEAVAEAERRCRAALSRLTPGKGQPPEPSGLALAEMILDFWSEEDPDRMGRGMRAIWDAASAIKAATGGET